MKKVKHDIKFFLTNPSFVKWINDSNEESDYYWKKWIESHPEDRSAFYAAKAIVERMDFKVARVTGEDKERILGNILKEEGSEHYTEVPQRKYQLVKFRKQITQIAATAAILFGLAYYFIEQTYINHTEQEVSKVYQVTRQTERGQQKKIILPDGTSVLMNASTSLTYSSDFGREKREVVLNGEAYFDVTHNPDVEFIVKSGNISTVVHGTAFNIYAYPNEEVINVALERGSVAIHGNEGLHEDPVFIRPGEKLAVTGNLSNSVKSKFNYIEEFGWKERVLVFKDSGINEFINKLERWYNVDISVVGSSDEDWKINGLFKKQGLENVLEGLEFARKVKYTVKEDKVIIYTSVSN